MMEEDELQSWLRDNYPDKFCSHLIDLKESDSVVSPLSDWQEYPKKESERREAEYRLYEKQKKSSKPQRLLEKWKGAERTVKPVKRWINVAKPTVSR